MRNGNEINFEIFIRTTHFYGSLVWPVAKSVRRTIFHRHIRFNIFSDGRKRLYRNQAGGVVIAQAIRRVVCLPMLLINTFAVHFVVKNQEYNILN